MMNERVQGGTGGGQEDGGLGLAGLGVAGLGVAGSAAGPDDAAALRGNLDAAVVEVFASMLQTECVPAQNRIIGGEWISAEIRMSGGREGRCVVELPVTAGDWITDALIGSEADWDDQMIEDALGELCNMITGSVKRRLGSWPGECGISLPAVRRLSGEAVDSPGAWRFYRVAHMRLAVKLEFRDTGAG